MNFKGIISPLLYMYDQLRKSQVVKTAIQIGNCLFARLTELTKNTINTINSVLYIV